MERETFSFATAKLKIKLVNINHNLCINHCAGLMSFTFAIAINTMNDRRSWDDIEENSVEI
jgi:hypothetical protein